ncbi:hypothetical protein A5876_000950 [Enterococcus sp. 3C8_DIV0646]|nr:hypothetical protein A5876_000950 [Enterococcus sp. 3C8_DIV0646]
MLQVMNLEVADPDCFDFSSGIQVFQGAP